MSNSDGISVSTIVVFVVVVLIVLGAGLYGCPQYNVYSSRMRGQAELAQAQGNRQALVAQAAAEDEASIKRAEAAGRRVAGWVKAAKEGCETLGRTGDELKTCEDMLIKDNLTFSVAHEGSPGVTVIVGTQANVAVPPGKADAAK
ncbi:MAG: hypothetical protein ACXU8U_08170 [Asticcacaulis sp.]